MLRSTLANASVMLLRSCGANHGLSAMPASTRSLMLDSTASCSSMLPSPSYPATALIFPTWEQGSSAPPSISSPDPAHDVPQLCAVPKRKVTCTLRKGCMPCSSMRDGVPLATCRVLHLASHACTHAAVSASTRESPHLVPPQAPARGGAVQLLQHGGPTRHVFRGQLQVHGSMPRAYIRQIPRRIQAALLTELQVRWCCWSCAVRKIFLHDVPWTHRGIWEAHAPYPTQPCNFVDQI